MSVQEKLTAIAENEHKVYEAGKKAGGIDWDAFQEGGARTNYDYAFFRSWTDGFFNPKYAIAGSVKQAFYLSQITDIRVPIVATGAFNSVWQGAEVVTIPSLDITEVTGISSAFYNAKQLTNLTFVGLIKVNGLDLSHSEKLTKESLLTVLNCLEDKSEDTSGTQWMVSLGATNKAKLTAEELAIASDKGWVVK